MANYIPRDHLGEDYGEDRSEMTPSRRRKIHRDIAKKKASGQTLPFDIRAPKKDKINKVPIGYLVCEKCGRNISVMRTTYMVICGGCGELIKTDE
jgi:hypothetical protein